MMAQVESLTGGLLDVEVLGSTPEGVKVHTLGSEPGSFLVYPASWIIGANASQTDVAWRLTDNQRAVLKALASAGRIGMIDDDHEAINGLRADSAGKRRLELARKGFVVASGKRRQTRRGSTAEVWVVTEAGRAALTRS